MLKTESPLQRAQSDNVIGHWYRTLAYFYDPAVHLDLVFVGGEGQYRNTFITFIDPKPGERIAELCCGTGAVTMALARKVGTPVIMASDLSRDQVRVAKFKSKIRNIDINFAIYDASNTPYPSGSFDKVVISRALHEIEKERRMKIYQEVQRLLKPGGIFCLGETHRPAKGWGRCWIDLIFCKWNPEHKTAYTFMEGLKEELDEAGFKIMAKQLSNCDTFQHLKVVKG